jgi:hypothetical protein
MASDYSVSGGAGMMNAWNNPDGAIGVMSSDEAPNINNNMSDAGRPGNMRNQPAPNMNGNMNPNMNPNMQGPGTRSLVARVQASPRGIPGMAPGMAPGMIGGPGMGPGIGKSNLFTPGSAISKDPNNYRPDASVFAKSMNWNLVRTTFRNVVQRIGDPGQIVEYLPYKVRDNRN